MLSLYYGIGRYVSANSREGFWGTGAIRTISERLRKELPGLRGFSESSLKNMRMFYEEWSPILESTDSASSISPILIGEIETTLLLSSKSTITIDDLELFRDLSFTHHVRILNRELNCLVVVELKTGNFKPGYLAQLMTYLRILDDKVKKPHENPSIGIVLCKMPTKTLLSMSFRIMPSRWVSQHTV